MNNEIVQNELKKTEIKAKNVVELLKIIGQPLPEPETKKAPRGRPKGSKNRPGYKKPGRRPKAKRLPEAEILAYKEKIIQMFDNREVDNLSQAANALGLSKIRVYGWKPNDPDWARMLMQAEELIADELEEKLLEVKNVPQCTALIFRLKALRPEKYRETYKFDVRDSRALEHINNIKKFIKQESQEETPAKAETPLPEASVALPTPVEQ